MQVWAWPIAPSPPGDQSPLCDEPILSLDEVARADRFHFAKDRAAFVAAHVGLRKLLAAVTAVAAGELQFSSGAFGKPALAPSVDTCVKFNLSHSGAWAMAALSTTGEIGVDVELHRECDQSQAIAHRHFTPNEASAFAAGDHRRRFFDLWTGKEAVIKLLGSGLQFPLTDFETPAATAQSGWIDLPSDNPLRLDRCWLERLALGDGYSAAVAGCEQPLRVECARLANAGTSFP